MTLRNKITFGSILIILLSYIIVAVVVSIYMNKVFIDQVQIRIRHDLFSAHQIYDDYVEGVEWKNRIRWFFVKFGDVLT